jgi:hypothetical protein
MANIKLNLSDSTEKSETVAIEKKTELFKNRIPSNWNITSTKEGIEAFNSVSSESFKGTIKEFNKRLRG